MNSNASIQRVPITLRALTARINRHLAGQGQALKRSRGMTASTALGDHYLVDLARNQVAVMHVDIERLARDLGVLAGWEELAESQASSSSKD
jgi:hypothetical protein